MKALLHQKVDKKPSISRTYTLIPQKASIDLCPCHASRNLVLATYILALLHNVTFVSLSVCLLMTNFGKTTFSHVQQATAITVPITTMEWRIIFIRQIVDNFKNTVRLMFCMCCGFDRPIRVLKQDVRVLIVVQKQHLTSANTM